MIEVNGKDQSWQKRFEAQPGEMESGLRRTTVNLLVVLVELPSVIKCRRTCFQSPRSQGGFSSNIYN